MRILWNHIAKTWPNVKEARILLRGLRRAGDTGGEELDTLIQVTTLPNLQRVVIGNADVVGPPQLDVMGCWVDDERRKLVLVDALERQAERLGKHLSVDTVE